MKKIWMHPYKFESDDIDKLAIFIETSYLKSNDLVGYEDLFFLYRDDDDISFYISDKFRHLIIGVDLV